MSHSLDTISHVSFLLTERTLRPSLILWIPIRECDTWGRIHTYIDTFSYIKFPTEPANKWWILLCCYCALMNCIVFLSSFCLDGPSEFSQSEAEGLHQEGQKSTQTRPNEQFPTNFAPVSKCWPRKVRNLYCIRLSYESLFSKYSITQWLELVPAWVGQHPGKRYRQVASFFF